MKQTFFILLLCFCSFLLSQADNSRHKQLIKVNLGDKFNDHRLNYLYRPNILPMAGLDYETYLTKRLSIQTGFQTIWQRSVSDGYATTNCWGTVEQGDLLRVTEVSMQIPLQIKYHLGKGEKFSFAPSIGIMGERIMSESRYFNTESGNKKTFVSLYPHANQNYLSAGMGFSFERTISQKLMVFLEPSIWRSYFGIYSYRSQSEKIRFPHIDMMLKFGVGYKL